MFIPHCLTTMEIDAHAPYKQCAFAENWKIKNKWKIGKLEYSKSHLHGIALQQHYKGMYLALAVQSNVGQVPDTKECICHVVIISPFSSKCAEIVNLSFLSIKSHEKRRELSTASNVYWDLVNTFPQAHDATRSMHGKLALYIAPWQSSENAGVPQFEFACAKNETF